MDLSFLLNVFITGVVAGLSAYAALRVEIKYLRRDVDHAHKRIDKVEKVLYEKTT